MSKKYAPEKDQAVRRTGIGGSDAAVICGESQFVTARELYHIKRGEHESDFISDRDHVWWGTHVEDVIAKRYAMKTGRKLHHVNQTQRHAEYPFLMCHPDRRVVGEKRLFEAKNVNSFVYSQGDWGETGTDEIPMSYLLQCQHELMVMDYPVIDLAAHIGSGDVRIYTILRDDDLIASMMALEIEFWTMVQDGVLPPLQFTHNSTSALIGKLYPGTNGMAYEGTADDLVDSARLIEVKAEMKALESEKKTLTNKLKNAAGNSAVFVLPDGSGYSRSAVDATQVSYLRKSYVTFNFNVNARKKASTLQYVEDAALVSAEPITTEETA